MPPQPTIYIIQPSRVLNNGMVDENSTHIILLHSSLAKKKKHKNHCRIKFYVWEKSNGEKVVTKMFPHERKKISGWIEEFAMCSSARRRKRHEMCWMVDEKTPSEEVNR